MKLAARLTVPLAVIAVPLTAALASYVLTEDVPPPDVPAQVRIGQVEGPDGGDSRLGPSGTQQSEPAPGTSTMQVVPPPPPISDDDDDDQDDDSDDDGDDDEDDD
ncbi:hypothetical protein [Amycolatopsis marina]|nr:hypothetical protein [Amycolatopsis marina]